MKIKSVIVAIALGISLLWAPTSSANQKPIIESFTFNPNEIDIVLGETKINFELVVSHPSGIANLSTMATLTNSSTSNFSTYLTRTDSPVNYSLEKVIFKGVLVIPRNIEPGIFKIKADSISNNTSAGYQFGTGIIEPSLTRPLLGGESGLLVRSNGELNLLFETFVGPAYDSKLSFVYNDQLKYNSNNIPIWKVGETFLPSKYFELRVPTLELLVTSRTPKICSSDGKKLDMIMEGDCSFTVSTVKTKDYMARSYSQSVTVTSARLKTELPIEKIANQDSKNLPKTITIPKVYHFAEGYVMPQSLTPTVCVGLGFYVKIVGGGTCTLSYQVAGSSTYLASDIYKVSFEITRDLQTITFAPSVSANISSKSIALTAAASSGGVITYSTTSAGVCSITGSTLNLLKAGNCSVTATQVGTSTLAPASATANITITGTVVAVKKTITCVKGKTAKKVTSTNPKCPTGYKLKK
jgi:hypothetical protein